MGKVQLVWMTPWNWILVNDDSGQEIFKNSTSFMCHAPSGHGRSYIIHNSLSLIFLIIFFLLPFIHISWSGKWSVAFSESLLPSTCNVGVIFCKMIKEVLEYDKTKEFIMQKIAYQNFEIPFPIFWIDFLTCYQVKIKNKSF